MAQYNKPRNRNGTAARATALSLGIELKDTDKLFELGRLLRHCDRRRSSLFDQCSILLRGVVDFSDCTIDLFNTLALLGRCGGYFTHDVCDEANATDDFCHRGARLVDQF